jgi:hypothetical protein
VSKLTSRLMRSIVDRSGEVMGKDIAAPVP